MSAGVAILAAGAVMVATTTLAPPKPPTSLPAPPISTQAVQLAALPGFLQTFWDLASGADPDHPLPSPSNPIAPIAEQLVLNLTTYGHQLLAGQGTQIPAEVTTHLANIGKVLQGIPDLVTQTVYNTVGAIQVSAAGGVLFGALAGGGLASAVFGSIPGLSEAAAGQFGTVIGAIVGVAVCVTLAVLAAPGGWVMSALSLRNDIATALASPAPPGSASQPAASTPAASRRTAATTPHPTTQPSLRPNRHIATPSAPAAAPRIGIGHARDGGSTAGSRR
jgi:hypothetical protein